MNLTRPGLYPNTIVFFHPLSDDSKHMREAPHKED